MLNTPEALHNFEQNEDWDVAVGFKCNCLNLFFHKRK